MAEMFDIEVISVDEAQHMIAKRALEILHPEQAGHGMAEQMAYMNLRLQPVGIIEQAFEELMAERGTEANVAEAK